MALFELDDVFTYQDANDIKRLWAATTEPTTNLAAGEIWLDISTTPYQLKRYNGSTWDIIGDMSGQDVLDLLKTVDGSGSGLDADKLDGQDSTFYRNADNINAGTISLDRIPDSLTGKNADQLDGQEGSYYQNASNLNAGTIALARIPATLTGKDADTLDGQEGSYYRNASNLNSGTVYRGRLGDLWLDVAYGQSTMPFIQSGHGDTVPGGGWHTATYTYAYDEIPHTVALGRGFTVKMSNRGTTTSVAIYMYNQDGTIKGGDPINWIAIGRRS